MSLVVAQVGSFGPESGSCRLQLVDLKRFIVVSTVKTLGIKRLMWTSSRVLLVSWDRALKLNQPLTNILKSFISGSLTYYEKNTTLNNGYLGSRNDEERSEMRYVM